MVCQTVLVSTSASMEVAYCVSHKTHTIVVKVLVIVVVKVKLLLLLLLLL